MCSLRNFFDWARFLCEINDFSTSDRRLKGSPFVFYQLQGLVQYLELSSLWEIPVSHMSYIVLRLVNILNTVVLAKAPLVTV